MNRQLLYLLLVLVLIVAVSPILLRLSQMPPSEAEGFAPPKGGLSRASSEGFAPPRVAPFALEPPRPAEPHSILVSEPSIHEPFQGVSPSNKPVVAVSDTAYDAMSLKQRSDTLKDIQQIVREEIRAARTQPLLASASPAVASPAPSALASPSAQQGVDYQRRCDKDQDQDQEYRCPKNPDGSCPPVPDLSQYIRKDQIPCWGCAINY